MRTRLPHAVVLLLLGFQLGANYQTRNFVVTAPTPQLAREIAIAAEKYRRTLALDWLQRELPDWSEPCVLEARVGSHLRPNGLTSFAFRNGYAYGWRIDVQGNRQRVLQDVLPHEITHAVFASHFGRPLPRWADEGVSILVETTDARNEQHRKLIEYVNTGRTVSLPHLFAMNDYPPDILPLYSQGHSLVSFLVLQGGRQKFVEFIEEGMQSNDWAACTQRHYEFESLGHLQRSWLDWVATTAWPNATLASQESEPASDTPSSTTLARARLLASDQIGTAAAASIEP